MTNIIHGATGAQGAPVVAALLSTDQSAVAAVRDPSTYTGGGSAIAVDLSSVESLVAAYTGADAIFVHLPIGPVEVQQRHAEVIVEAVRQARPTRVVVSTSGYPFGAPGDASPMDVLLDGLRSVDISLAIVAPKLYLENLLLPPVSARVSEAGILRYPVREDYAISWSSHLDVADVVARLIKDTSVSGLVGVGALLGLVGDDLAAGFASHFGKSVTFEAQTPDDFSNDITPLFGEAGATPVVDSYRWRATQPHEVIDESTSAQKLLGLKPRSIVDWLTDLSV